MGKRPHYGKMISVNPRAPLPHRRNTEKCMGYFNKKGKKTKWEESVKHQ